MFFLSIYYMATVIGLLSDEKYLSCLFESIRWFNGVRCTDEEGILMIGASENTKRGAASSLRPRIEEAYIQEGRNGS